ncbi:MAG: 5-deoxy-glucuronate isomerase [Rhodospirillales bacterium]|nr:MAG: 5-deoxy-glucuronate isomerase [Rhodospirillales bacterium]
MARLLVKPHARDEDGSVLSVTPESAGWQHVGFEICQLEPDDVLARGTGDREVCLVLLAGRARISAGDAEFGIVGERNSPFEGKPWAVYVPARSRYEVSPATRLELAICSAPGTGKYPPRLIQPQHLSIETRGEGTNKRFVCNILPEQDLAESLLVVEVITPGGNWSSYPPHKHDHAAAGAETQLEETYYHRLKPAQGFALQRVYTDDRSIDETMAVEDGDCVMVPRGYHPVGAPHGYDLYYLNVMAGPERAWRFRNDPAHDWIIKKV